MLISRGTRAMTPGVIASVGVSRKGWNLASRGRLLKLYSDSFYSVNRVEPQAHDRQALDARVPIRDSIQACPPPHPPCR